MKVFYLLEKLLDMQYKYIEEEKIDTRTEQMLKLYFTKYAGSRLIQLTVDFGQFPSNQTLPVL